MVFDCVVDHFDVFVLWVVIEEGCAFAVLVVGVDVGVVVVVQVVQVLVVVLVVLSVVVEVCVGEGMMMVMLLCEVGGMVDVLSVGCGYEVLVWEVD